MIAFAGMLENAAKLAGISVPEEPDNFEEHRNTHPHFYVFCATQLCRPVVSPGEHWNNAKIVALVPSDRIRTITLEELISAGYSYPQI
jgi:hypothetical protein